MPRRSIGLTIKMRNFCNAYARTGNATQAYLEAYDTTNEQIASNEGSKLLLRDDVTEYLKELNKPTINKIVNEREKKRQLLWKAIYRCEAKEDESSMARYMDILNKMDSEYVNINHNIDDGSEKLISLTNDQLKALIDKPADE